MQDNTPLNQANRQRTNKGKFENYLRRKHVNGAVFGSTYTAITLTKMANHPISDIEPLFSDGALPSDFHQGHCEHCLKFTGCLTVADRQYCESCADELFDANGDEIEQPQPLTFPSFALKVLTVALVIVCVTIFVASVLMENSEVTAIKAAIFGANQ